MSFATCIRLLVIGALCTPGLTAGQDHPTPRPISIDDQFARRYLELLGRVVHATSGMRFSPQVEMLWLRDHVPEASVALHGAFGELAKLSELRDYRLDDAMLAARRDEVPGLLWKRYEPGYRARLRILSPELRSRLEPLAREALAARLASIPADLGAPEALQAIYLREFLRSTRFGHQLWNERVDTRFPFVHPAFVDQLLRVRTEDRLVQRFQRRFLERIDPRLLRVADENTGTLTAAPLWWQRALRMADRIRTVLRGEGIETSHGDLLGWLTAAEPPLEQILEACPDDGVFDLQELRSMVSALRAHQSRSGLRRGMAARALREEALALQSFLVLQLGREMLGWSP